MHPTGPFSGGSVTALSGSLREELLHRLEQGHASGHSSDTTRDGRDSGNARRHDADLTGDISASTLGIRRSRDEDSRENSDTGLAELVVVDRIHVVVTFWLVMHL